MAGGRYPRRKAARKITLSDSAFLRCSAAGRWTVHKRAYIPTTGEVIWIP